MTQVQYDRYADVVGYNIVNHITVIVVEVKQQKDAPCRAQNNEQMAGLWDEKQKLMLGLEVSGGNVVRPKVLLRQGSFFT